MIRRVLFVASILVMLWTGPASADHTYGHVLDTGQDQGGAVDGAGVGAGVGAGGSTGGQRARGDNLARTGSKNVTPLVQAAVILIGGGTMLVFVARRRYVARNAAT